MEASSSYNMTSAEGEVLLEAIELAQELQEALQQPPASSLCNSGHCSPSFSRVQSVLQDYKQAEDLHSDSISWGQPFTCWNPALKPQWPHACWALSHQYAVLLQSHAATLLFMLNVHPSKSLAACKVSV